MSDRQRVARVSGFGALALGTLLAIPCPAAAANAAPTFTKDVAPIFQAKCEACHRPDGMAPMSLVTYEDARPWAKSISARVGGRQMPPWHIDKTVGIQKFKNDRSLDDDQIETIRVGCRRSAKGRSEEHAAAQGLARRHKGVDPHE